MSPSLAYVVSQDPLKAPYLNAPLRHSTPTLSFALGNVLYSLGVILIKLGLDVPLNTCNNQKNPKTDMPAQCTDFLTAKSLADYMSSKLG